MNNLYIQKWQGKNQRQRVLMLDTNGFDDLKNNIIKKALKKNKNDKSQKW